MSRKRIGVLYEIWWPEELPAPPRGRIDEAPLQPAEDGGPEVQEEVYRTLEELGYLPSHVVLDGTKKTLVRLARTGASLFFNLTESYAGDDTKDMHVAAYLELLGKPYTGNDPRALHLGQDKALAKKVLRYHGVPTPDFTTTPIGSRGLPRELEYPLIVKPLREDGSIGIDSGSVVYDDKSLRERIRYIHRSFASTALLERYVPGREIYVSIVGNDPPEPLALIEVDLSGLPRDVPRIAGTEVKWLKGTETYRRTPPVFPKDIPRALKNEIQKTAVAAYRALGLRDYGRVDLRLTEQGEVYVLEVNPNPWLASECEFFMAWEKTGRSYPDLIDRLVQLAFQRRV